MKLKHVKRIKKHFLLMLPLLLCVVHASGQSVASASNSSENIYFVLGDGVLGGTATLIVQADTSQTGIAQTHYSSSVKVYPNPVSERLKITTQTQAETYCLVGISGQVLIKRNEAFTETELDLSSFTSGSYVLQVQFTNHTETYTIIKK